MVNATDSLNAMMSEKTQKPYDIWAKNMEQRVEKLASAKEAALATIRTTEKENVYTKK